MAKSNLGEVDGGAEEERGGREARREKKGRGGGGGQVSKGHQRDTQASIIGSPP